MTLSSPHVLLTTRGRARFCVFARRVWGGLVFKCATDCSASPSDVVGAGWF